MKVLFIDVTCKYGSTGNIVYSLHQSCIANGIESAVCYGRGPKLREPNIHKFGLNIETYIHAFLTRVTGYTGCFSFFSTRRLIKFIKKFNPDIVHIHELHAYFVNVVPLLSFLKKRGTKVIFTNHCEFLYTGKCGHSKECTRYQDQCGSCPHVKDYPASLFFDHTAHMLFQKKSVFQDWDNCYFTSPSKWLNNKMSLSFLKDKARFVVHNGIDTKQFFFSGSKTKQGKQKTILSIAPNIMSDLKGGYRVLELAKRFQQEEINFILVGSDKKISGELPSNATILPRINDKNKLIQLYNSADAFLICSSNETFPTTSLEAQCCGLPIYGFDVGGVKETIVEGNGILVPFPNIDALEELIRRQIFKPIDHQAISKRGIARFSNDTMFENYLHLYQGLLGR